MFKITLIILNLFAHSAFANDVICNIKNDPRASTLLIEYSEETPVLLSLKDPDSSEYRKLDLIIESIPSGNDTESFSAKPKIQQTIDWDLEPNCFKEIGTQWYFVLNFSSHRYGVYLSPFMALENNSCVPPRFRPQPKELDCFKIKG